jgi:RNA-directed DNA polymerase
MNSSQTTIKTTEIKTIKHLEAILKVKIVRIQEIIDSISTFYYEKKELKLDKDGNVKHENGQPKYRIIYPSTGDLKKLQTTIHKKILSKIYLPTNVKGGVKGCDNILNAKVHQGNKYKFVTDLKDFYPSISSESVVKMFIRNGFSKKIAQILTQLTTYNKYVPQGAPTSGSIANLVFVPTDKILIEICKSYNLKYTRYVDDLTFSSKIDFHLHCNEIIEIILKSGFKVSRKKTFYKSGKIEITGVEVGNNIIKEPQRISEKIEKMKAASLNKPISDSEKGLKNYADRIKKIKKIEVKKIEKKRE